MSCLKKWKILVEKVHQLLQATTLCSGHFIYLYLQYIDMYIYIYIFLSYVLTLMSLSVCLVNPWAATIRETFLLLSTFWGQRKMSWPNVGPKHCEESMEYFQDISVSAKG